MGPLRSSPYSQQPATCPYLQPDKSSPNPIIHIFITHLNIILPATTKYSIRLKQQHRPKFKTSWHLIWETPLQPCAGRISRNTSALSSYNMLLQSLRSSYSLSLLNYSAHSALYTAFCGHLLTISCRSFPTPSNHLGLPILRLLRGILSNILLTVLPWSVLTTCPTHSNPLFLTSATMSKSLHSSHSSWFSSYSPHSLLYHCSIYPS
jgi:hypothetical protein